MTAAPRPLNGPKGRKPTPINAQSFIASALASALIAVAYLAAMQWLMGSR